MEGPSEGNGRLSAHGVLAKLTWALRSEPGDVRPHNEDFAGVFAPTIPDDSWDRPPVFAVCDGLGGHAAGEVASRTAVEALLAAWREGSPSAPHRDVRAGARAANTAVYDAALEQGRMGMATTLTALWASVVDLSGLLQTDDLFGADCPHLKYPNEKWRRREHRGAIAFISRTSGGQNFTVTPP